MNPRGPLVSKDGVNASLEGGSEAHQEGAMAKQRPKITDPFGRDPGLRKEVCTK